MGVIVPAGAGGRPTVEGYDAKALVYGVLPLQKKIRHTESTER